MASYKELFDYGVAKLTNSTSTTPILDTEILLSYTAGVKRNELLFYLDKEHKNAEDFKHQIDIRLQGKPIEHIVGEKEFWSIPIMVNSDTLTPRPESELIVELAIKYSRSSETLLDLGTGSGALIVALVKELKNLKKIIGIDISMKALKVARLNVTKLDKKVHLINSSWFDGLNLKFDLIVANPPYMSLRDWSHSLVRYHEPKVALTDELNGLSHYDYLLKQLRDFLSDQGKAIFELGHDQLERILDKVKMNHLKVLDIAKDLRGIDRTMVLTKSD